MKFRPCFTARENPSRILGDTVLRLEKRIVFHELEDGEAIKRRKRCLDEGDGIAPSNFETFLLPTIKTGTEIKRNIMPKILAGEKASFFRSQIGVP